MRPSSAPRPQGRAAALRVVLAALGVTQGAGPPGLRSNTDLVTFTSDLGEGSDSCGARGLRPEVHGESVTLTCGRIVTFPLQGMMLFFFVIFGESVLVSETDKAVWGRCASRDSWALRPRPGAKPSEAGLCRLCSVPTEF